MRMSFDQWMLDVNVNIGVVMGLASEDLPDCPYYDWYEDGCSPVQAARRAMKRAAE